MKRAACVVILLTLCGSAAAISWPLGGIGGRSVGSQWVDLVPSLSWSPSSLAFSNHSTGTLTSATFTLSNSGNDTAEDVTTSVTGAGFRLYSSTTFGNISSGRSRTAKVAFEPVAGVAYSGFLSYSAPNIARVGAALSGTGVAPEGVDSTPDAFIFTDQTDVALSSTITSATITVTGIDTASVISVTGGTYDVNASGSFTASSGTVSNGDTVRAQHTSSASNSAATDTVVTIGGVSGTFSSTTLAVDPYTIYWANSVTCADGVSSTVVGACTTTNAFSSMTDSLAQMSVNGNALVVTMSASSTTATANKTAMTAHQDVRWQADVKFGSVTATGNFSQLGRVSGPINSMTAMPEVYTSGGVIAGIRIKYQDGDLTQHTSANYPYAFQAGITYTIAMMIKGSTDTATTDGYYSLTINGADIIPETAIKTAGVTLNAATFGVQLQSGATTNIITFDNLSVGYK